jgi:hypothetical protein
MLCVCLNTIPYFTGCAQVQQLKRIEIKLGKGESEYKVLPAQTFGVLLYRTQAERKQGTLEMHRLDTTLQDVWKNTIPIEKKFMPILSKQAGATHYLLFVQSEYRESNFRLLHINLHTGGHRLDTVFNIIPFLPTQLEINHLGALIGGYLANRIPIVVFYEFSTRKTRVLPGLFNEPGELLQIQVYDDQSFNVLISTQPHPRLKTLWVKHYEATGSLKYNTRLLTDNQVSLLSGRVLKTPQNDLVIAGTYGLRSADYSSGLFIARINAAGDQETRYYPFYTLENFFKYLRPRQEQRLRMRIERKISQGKRTRLQYRLMVHELVPWNGQLILLGEAYYPVYKRDDRFNYGLAVSAYVPYIFDGYRYTHAVVIGFDYSGNLLWDNSFEINDIKTFNLEQFVKMDYRNNNIALLYLFDNRIRSKRIQNSQVLEGKTLSSLSLSFEPEDPELDDDVKRLEYWYPGAFLAYGIQRPNSHAVSRTRERFFFINKVAYR